MEQEVISILQSSPEIVSRVADRIYHVHIGQGKLYPSVAFMVEVNKIGSCVDGSTFGGLLRLMIEAENMADIVYLRKHSIQTFEANKNYRLISATPDIESTSKKYYAEIEFKIIRIDEL